MAKIQIKTFKPTEHKLKALIYWSPKSGKTTFAGTAPRPLFICAENGLLSIASKSPDYVEVKSLQELKDLYLWLKDNKPDYDTIVIDSLSEISKIIKDNLTNNGQRAMVLRDWGTFSEEMMQALRQIVNLPYHVICIIHSKEVVDDSWSVEMYDIAVEGKAKNEIPRYFDIIGFSYIDKQGNYNITIKGSSKTLCWDRSNTIDKENTPLDINQWIDAISHISDTTPQKVVAEIESKAQAEVIVDAMLWEKYQQIDDSLSKDSSPASINALRVKINGAKNLTDEQKTNLLLYIDSKWLN